MIRALLLLLLLVGCRPAEEPKRAPVQATPAPVDAGPKVASVRMAVEEPEPFSPEVRSLRVRRSIVVRAEPREDGKALGTIAQDTRVGWFAAVQGPGCERWIAIQPRGYVCDRYLQPVRHAPRALVLPKLKPDELVPGVYGRVRVQGAKAFRTVEQIEADEPERTLAGSVRVRKKRELTVKEKLYWETTSGELILAKDLAVQQPSRFAGLTLEGFPGKAPTPPDGGVSTIPDKLPIAWTRSLKEGVRVATRRAAKAGSATVRRLAARSPLAVREQSPDGSWLRIGDDEWVRRADVHLAEARKPPPLTGADERWIDVDLDEQLLVAYQGERPVFATLISSGSKKWPTPTGVFRIWIKFAEADMNGQMGDEQPYSVATVPWTMFYAKDFALHTAYWHDGFGETRSHGCVNLSPLDARTVYYWTDPDVPNGWSMANGLFERPGSLIRIRNKADPEPAFQGYARRVQDLRERGQDPAAGFTSKKD